MTGAFTPAQRVAVLWIGVAGVLVPGLQPQLLGALAAEGRVSESMLGHIATVELLAMGLAAGTAGLLLARAGLRHVAAAAIVACVVMDLLSVVAGVPLLAVRAAAGLAEGVLVWIAIGLIVRSAIPARWSALYLAVQTAAQFALATILALAVIPSAGSVGGFAGLAIATAAALLALPWLPKAYAPLVREEAAAARIPPRGIVALAGVLLYLAFVVAVWVYVEPVAHLRGIAPASIALVAPLSLAMQVLGALLAMRLAGRVPALPVLIAIGAANLLLLAVLGTTHSATAFLLATSAFGFLWLFAMPFHVPVTIAADPQRRSAELIGGAQLLGSGLGPFAAGVMTIANGVGIVLWLGAACLILSLLLFLLAVRR